MPLFSIVMPTRNRAHLLRYALQSALAQQFADYEIVVSDNNSTDDTADVVRRIGDGKVKYVHTGQTLAMPDSWEFALTHATGEFITYLCDDDAIVPDLLPRLSQLLGGSDQQVISWGRTNYFHSTWYEPEKRNTVVIPSAPFVTRVMKARPSLAGLFRDPTYTTDVPLMLNCACHKQLIARGKSPAGHFFFAAAPDTSTAALALALADHYTHIFEPLCLGGMGKESIGATQGYNRGTTATAFRSEFCEDIFSRVPLKGYTITNTIVATLLNVKSSFPELFSEYDIDWSSYFYRHCQELLSLKSRGVDVSQDEQEFFRVLAAQSQEIQDHVQRSIEGARWPEQALRNARRIVRHGLLRGLHLLPASVVDASRQLTGRTLGDPRRHGRIIRGEEVGFANIFECSQMLKELLAQ